MITEIRPAQPEEASHRALLGLDRYHSAIAILLLGVHAALAWLARQPGILTEGDDAIYIMLGRALQNLHYRELFQIDRPIHRMYPPGYPAILAVWSAIGGEGFDWLVIINIACSVGALALLYFALRRLWGRHLALACLAGLVANPRLVDSAGKVASEPPFVFFEILALWAFTRNHARPGVAALAGAAAIAAALTRSVGVTLIAAITLFWLWQRRFRAVAIYAVIGAVTVGLWLGWTTAAPEQVPGESYVADAVLGASQRGRAAMLIDRLTNKAPYLIHLYRAVAPTIPNTPIDNVIGGPIVMLALLAGLPRLFTTWPVVLAYLAAYGGLLWLWPWPVPRFLVPILPLIVPVLIAGFARLVALVRPRWEVPAAFLFAGVLALHGSFVAYRAIEHRRDCVLESPLSSGSCLYEDEASFLAAVQYVQEHVPPKAIFVSGKPATLYLYTGHQVVSLPMALSQSPSDFLPFLRRQGVTHVLLLLAMPFSDGVSPSRGLPLGPMLKANCDRLHLEVSFPPSSFVFRVPAVGETIDGAAACGAVETYLEAAARHRTLLDGR